MTVTVSIFMIFISSMICSAQDAGMVAGIQKAKAFYEAGEKKGQEVMLLDFLKPGDKIRLEPDTVLILNYFEPGVREEITGPGTIKVGTGSVRESGTVKIVRTETCKLPPKVFLRGEDIQQSGAVALRKDGKRDSIVILSLAGTAVRPSSRLVLRWQPVKTAELYSLKIYDIMNNLHSKAATKETAFICDKSDLKCNELYTWQVSASAHGKTYEGNGSFSILSENILKKVIQAEDKIKAECPKKSDELLIRLAFIYRYYELIDESADMLRELHRRHPRNGNIQRWLRQTDPAERVLKK